VKDQILKAASKTSYRITCPLCSCFKVYADLEDLDWDLTFNYELCALVYKHKTALASQARSFYQDPDLQHSDPLIEIMRVKRLPLARTDTHATHQERLEQ
jgi:hypothetical protein